MEFTFNTGDILKFYKSKGVPVCYGAMLLQPLGFHSKFWTRWGNIQKWKGVMLPGSIAYFSVVPRWLVVVFVSRVVVIESM